MVSGICYKTSDDCDDSDDSQVVATTGRGTPRQHGRNSGFDSGKSTLCALYGQGPWYAAF